MASVVKRPAGGAFGQWMLEKRAEIAAQVAAEGGKGVTAVSKKAGEMWQALGAEEKAPFEQKYQEAKAAFETYKSSEDYVAPVKKEKRGAKKDGKREKKAKDPDAPKRPVGGAYGVFMNEKRAEFTKVAAERGEKGLGAVAKLISEAFKNLSEEEKTVYDERAKKAQEEYKEAAIAYEKTKPPPVAEAKVPSDAATSFYSPRKATPMKRKASTVTKRTPQEKSAKSSRVANAPGVELDESTLVEAEKAGLKGALENLSRRADIVSAKGLDGAKLLSALVASDGLVNKAKHALLGA